MPLIKISVPAMHGGTEAQFITPTTTGPAARPSQGHAADQVSDAMATDFTSGLRLRIDVDRLSAHKISVRRWFYGSRMCRWRAAEESSAASVAAIRRRHRRICNWWRWQVMCSPSCKKLLRAAFVVINGKVYCPRRTVHCTLYFFFCLW